MKNKRSILIFLFILAMFLLSGCDGIGGDSKKKENEIVVKDIYSGSKGVDIEFIPNMPPLKLYQEEEFQIAVKITNKGAYQVRNGIINIAGDPGYINFENSKLTYTDTFALEEKTEFQPFDDQTIIDVETKAEFADNSFTEHDSSLLITLCYDYKAIFNNEVCIDPDIYNLKPNEKNCKVEKIGSSGQGGPVGISNVEVSMTKKYESMYPKIKMTITNFGKGEVINKNSINNYCSSKDIDKTSLNIIKIKNIEMGDFSINDFTCTPDMNNIRLKEKNVVVTCSLKEGSPKRIDENIPSYLTNLMVELEYGYSLSKMKTITVINKNK